MGSGFEGFDFSHEGVKRVVGLFTGFVSVIASAPYCFLYLNQRIHDNNNKNKNNKIKIKNKKKTPPTPPTPPSFLPPASEDPHLRSSSPVSEHLAS